MSNTVIRQPEADLARQLIPETELGSISYMTRTSPGWRNG